MKDLAGKTAFVTGAASGIGLGIATALARAGVKVMLCDMEDASLAAAVEALRLSSADVDGVERVSQGIDPSYVGELVVEGIENDWPYIFTDLDSNPRLRRVLPRSSRASTKFVTAFHGVRTDCGAKQMTRPHGMRQCGDQT